VEAKPAFTKYWCCESQLVAFEKFAVVALPLIEDPKLWSVMAALEGIPIVLLIFSFVEANW
jgi:hypothetical protein